MAAGGLSTAQQAAASATPAWQAPWFAALQPALDLVRADAAAGRWGAALNSLNHAAIARQLHNAAGRPLRFVDAASVQAASYEQHIWSSGQVPTRIGGDGSWHDLFNALVWLAFPHIKARLNALQAGIVAREGVGQTRGGLRDAATLFDENAVLFITSDRSMADALRGFDWHELFVRRRDAFRANVRVLAFGHALVDKLRAPYKAICAHAWIVDPGLAMADDQQRATQMLAQDQVNRIDQIDQIDQIVCDGLNETSLRTATFAPLPVLGIPGWWPANRDPAFYDDTSVFRAGRHRSTRLQGD